MRGDELGEFLRSRRQRADPAAVGFAAGGRRRTTGLRREELAALAGVTVSWLAKLEQGRARSVSPGVLEALARALDLGPAEREHLFALADLRPPTGSDPEPGPAGMTPALAALLDALEPNPAYVLDRCWDLVAWNRAEAALFPGLAGREGRRPNLLWLTFTDPELAGLMADHDEELVRLVAQFRVHVAAWPGDAALAALVERVSEASPRFAELWQARDVAPFETTRRRFDHPALGRVELDHHRLAVLDQPGLQLVVYTAVPGASPPLAPLVAREAGADDRPAPLVVREAGADDRPAPGGADVAGPGSG